MGSLRCVATQRNFISSTATACSPRGQQQGVSSASVDGSVLNPNKQRRIRTAKVFLTRNLCKNEDGGRQVALWQQKRREEMLVYAKVLMVNGVVFPDGEDDDDDDDGDGVDLAGADFDISRLEDFTERVHSEVLCVNALVDGEEDQVIVFKGFSSSLTRATPEDPSEPVLPPTAVILSIDRVRGPYKPSRPQYIQRGMSWPDFQTFLRESGL